jgi:hypothetical protein
MKKYMTKVALLMLVAATTVRAEIIREGQEFTTLSAEFQDPEKKPFYVVAAASSGIGVVTGLNGLNEGGGKGAFLAGFAAVCFWHAYKAVKYARNAGAEVEQNGQAS